MPHATGWGQLATCLFLYSFRIHETWVAHGTVLSLFLKWSMGTAAAAAATAAAVVTAVAHGSNLDENFSRSGFTNNSPPLPHLPCLTGSIYYSSSINTKDIQVFVKDNAEQIVSCRYGIRT